MNFGAASREGQFRLWRAIQDGRCETYSKLRSLANAILDQEQQAELFTNETRLNEAEKCSLDKVDRFIRDAGHLLQLITSEDLSIIERVVKSNAQACADELELVELLCRRTKNALLANVSKQEALNVC